MDQEVKEEFNKVNTTLNEFQKDFKEFKNFIIENVALKSDIAEVRSEMATKQTQFADDA